MRELCDKKKMLLIFDEVQTGIGRTGKMFAFQHYGVTPDMVTLAKALGGGLTIGAMIVRNKYAGVLKPGMHASTFGGNPVVCAASCAVLDTIKKEGLLAKALSNGKYFSRKLSDLKKKHAVISEVRGMGMMIGVELKTEGKEIAAACLKKGLLTNCTAEKVIRFLPPLIVTREQIDKALRIFESVIAK
jgi:acetylornithine/succinyldiaminopimelate/putrescine aminotransferase